MKKYINILLVAVLTIGVGFTAQGQKIATIAGTGVFGYSGDKASATAARIHWPETVTLDNEGRLLIADSKNNCVRRVSISGEITTIAGTGFGAGTGSGAYSGDGGPATAAELFYPGGLAVDTIGNIFIADVFNHIIRKIDTDGIITTIAGIPATPGASGDGGQATAAKFNEPSRVAVDTFGNIYIADPQNNKIRRIDAAGVVTTFAGDGTPAYAGDGGPAIAAKLFFPFDVAADDSGNVYIADELNECVRKVDKFGNISTIAGTTIPAYTGDGGPATACRMYHPTGVAVDDSGHVYITDNGNSCVRKVSRSSGIITTIVGADSSGYNGDGIPATAARIAFPKGLAVNEKGSIYIADQGNNRIRFVGSKTEGVKTINTSLATVNIYPNPGEGTFVIDISSVFTEQARVVISNIAGEQVFTSSVYTNRPASMKLEAPPGVYFLSASTMHGVWTGRVILR